jgi:hypothetical protein
MYIAATDKRTDFFECNASTKEHINIKGLNSITMDGVILLSTKAKNALTVNKQ